jgi:uncharacterized protein YyaL (SSP411 family)
MPNRLLRETSPYLRQHAHNPVDWYPWGSEALHRAKAENKLLIVSIGYSACHWCHVMEHESFEDEAVARIMNEHFICIKIDREERPDIDQVYMIAVQLMTGRGGWPLNCICLPDQRPVYGGTYFRRDDWKNLLLNLAGFWHEKPEEAAEYATKLTQGVKDVEHPVPSDREGGYTYKDLEEITLAWKRMLDPVEGGYARAPKFPLPNTWQFMMRYAALGGDQAATVLTRLTLEKMAHGGMYDQIGGGFARYSVDGRWHVPHFEKMLYDNAQLLSLYSEAWQWVNDPLYKKIVFETAGWLRRELLSPEGGFYSALDADSEGVEGKFYTFTKQELQAMLGDDEPLFSAWFHVGEEGNWEEEHTNVLFRKDDDTQIAAAFGLEHEEAERKIATLRERVLRFREQRIRPGLDTKLLASWNGMALKGFTDAFRAFNHPGFLKTAFQNAEFILANLLERDGSLRRSYASSAAGAGFLDDYAFVIDGFTGLYEVTFDEKWLNTAFELMQFAIEHFYDEATGLFYYTPSGGEKLIARKFEVMDNVIPSSNSAMAHNLWKLGHFYADDAWIAKSVRMLDVVSEDMGRHPSSYSNWAILLLWQIYGTWEIAITGDRSSELRTEMESRYVANKIIFGGKKGTLPLLADKTAGDNRIYVCRNRTCRLPVTSSKEAFEQLFYPLNH